MLGKHHSRNLKFHLHHRLLESEKYKCYLLENYRYRLNSLYHDCETWPKKLTLIKLKKLGEKFYASGKGFSPVVRSTTWDVWVSHTSWF